MLTDTSIFGIQALIYIYLNNNDGEPVSPKTIAKDLNLSQSYMGKITRQLTKANILRSYHGAKGGVALNQAAKEITLLAIVEAFQGFIIGNHCQQTSHHPKPVCSFHEAMLEIHQSVIQILSKWTLHDLALRPGPTSNILKGVGCKMGDLCKVIPKKMLTS
ncbi:MAG: Rrf2 family transcriptional regulator [Planctomycetota bacterium]